jgi:hypothetical protein
MYISFVKAMLTNF